MALLNALLSEQDLAALTNDQREFLVQRIDHAIDTSPEIHRLIGAQLQHAVQTVAPQSKIKVNVK